MATFYVSVTGNDLATGLTAATAFKTLERARDAMRGSPGADTAIVSGGTYEIATPLRLTELDNGSSFVAAAGQQPNLIGGKAIGNWTAGAGGIWTAPLNASDVRQLTLNGVRMTEARYPNETPSDPIKGGWLWAQEPAVGTDPLRQLTFDPGSLAGQSIEVGARIRVFTNASWASEVLTVQSVDTARNVVTFAQPASYDIGSASRFYVSGKHAQLDAPGEWWFDAAAKILHFKGPPGFAGTGAVASGLNDVIQIVDADGVRISGFTISDAASADAYPDRASAGIRLDGARNIVVENNVFKNLISGIHAEAFTSGITVRGNDFSHLWASAIFLDHASSQNQILSNKIRWTGEVFVAPAAITMHEGHANVISGNLIRDVSRNGIQNVNYAPGQPSGGNVIEFNTIVRSGQQSSDGGAIYVYSAPDRVHLGEIVRHNRIADTGGLETESGGFVPGAQFSHGIYLDDFTSRAQVHGNFVQTSVRGGIYLHGGTDNSVYNNITLGNKDIGIQLFEIGAAMTGNGIRQNIVGLARAGANYTEANPAFVPASAFHDNVYLQPSAAYGQFSGRSFADWRALGFDIGSVLYPDSVFRNPTLGDYRIKPGAIPASAGFSDLLWAHMSAFRAGQILSGSEGRDSLRGGAGNDILLGHSGDDLLEGGAGADDLDGAAGQDLVSYSSSAASVTVNLADSRFNLGDARGDIYSEIEGVYGSRFNDALTGDVGDNSLHGLAGDDLLIGGSGRDTLVGGAGNDRMQGGLGGDVYYVESTGDLVVDAGDASIDRVVSLVTFVLPMFVEHLSLTGGVGAGGTGNSSANSISGDASANSLSGLGGDDSLSGNAGADRLSGGPGRDVLVGGLDADTFVFAAPTDGPDIVSDFAVGEDKIGISRSGFGLSVLLLSSSSTPSVNGAGGQFLYDTDNGQLSFDFDGVGAAAPVLLATLPSRPILTAGDFALFV